MIFHAKIKMRVGDASRGQWLFYDCSFTSTEKLKATLNSELQHAAIAFLLRGWDSDTAFELEIDDKWNHYSLYDPNDSFFLEDEMDWIKLDLTDEH